MTHVKLHLEAVDGEEVWWAECDDVDGFTAAAPTLAELRSLLVMEQAIGPGFTEQLVGGELQGDTRVVFVRHQL